MELVKQVKCPYKINTTDATNWIRRKRIALRELKERTARVEDFDGDFYKKTKKEKEKTKIKKNLKMTMKRINTKEIKKILLVQDGKWINPFNCNTQMKLHNSFILRRTRAQKDIELGKNKEIDYDIFCYKIADNPQYKCYWNSAISMIEPSMLPLFVKGKKKKDLLIDLNQVDSDSEVSEAMEVEGIEIDMDEDTSDYIDCNMCGDTKMVKGTKCYLCPILGHKEVKEHNEKQPEPSYAEKVALTSQQVNEVLEEFEKQSICPSVKTDKTEDYDDRFCYNGGWCKKWDCDKIHPKNRIRYFCRWGDQCVRFKEGRCKFIHNPADKYVPLTQQTKEAIAKQNWNTYEDEWTTV